MKEFVEKLKNRLEERLQFYENRFEELSGTERDSEDWGSIKSYKYTIEIVNGLAEEYNNGWIPCSERLPEVEEQVLICAKRKYRDGSFKNIITTAMYEDGTIRENDSRWNWEDIEGEWDEKEDCCIIPKGWFEDRKYNPDGVLNYAVDDEVLAWQPLPAPYRSEKEEWKDKVMKHFTNVE